MGNPYFELIDAFREDARPSVLAEGRIVSLQPIRVRVRGLEITGTGLLAGAEFWQELQAGKIAVGDRVLLLTDDNQLFYLLCKVVTV